MYSWSRLGTHQLFSRHGFSSWLGQAADIFFPAGLQTTREAAGRLLTKSFSADTRGPSSLAALANPCEPAPPNTRPSIRRGPGRFRYLACPLTAEPLSTCFATARQPIAESLGKISPAPRRGNQTSISSNTHASL